MSNEYPNISIVITTWNRKAMLQEVLSNIQGIDYPNYEVILVDNHSVDGTVEMIRSEFSAVRIIVMPTSEYGPCEAMNIGFANASGEYVVVLDDDSYIEKDALTKMVGLFRDNPQVGIIAFHIFTAEGIDWTKNLPFRLTTFNGCAAGIRSLVLTQAGFYSSDFFTYINENDLSIRALAAGFDIIYAKEIVAYHRWSPLNRNNKRLIFFKVRNGLWFVMKYFSGKNLLIGVLRIIIPFSYASVREGAFFFYIKAVFSAFLSLPRIIKKRRVVSYDLQRRYLREDWLLFQPVYYLGLKKMRKLLAKVEQFFRRNK